jgi:DNA relaxase NicK
MALNTCRVDYYSYTVKNAATGDALESDWHMILSQIAPSYLIERRDEWDWKVPPRRNGYKMGFNIENAIYVWFNGKDIHVEITGDGCTILYDSALLLQIMAQTKHSATRVDIAHDIVCDVSPLEFVSLSESKTSASGHQSSKDGETRYIGSQKSERFCKVYRYNHPHPRSDRLRIEYTYKSFDAIAAATAICEHGEAVVAFSSGKRYKWGHEIFKSLKSPKMIEIKAHRKDRNTSKTLMWWKSSVLPALEKLVRTGDYTYEELLADIQAVSHRTDETR